MTYIRLIEQVARQTDMTKAEVRKVFGAFFQAVRDVIDTGDPLSIPGFGNFYIKVAASRSGRNPRTGQRVPIPGGPRLKFRLSPSMMDPHGGVLPSGWTRRGVKGKRALAEAAAASTL